MNKLNQRKFQAFFRLKIKNQAKLTCFNLLNSLKVERRNDSKNNSAKLIKVCLNI